MTKYFISFLLLVGLSGAVCDQVFAQGIDGEDIPVEISIAQVSDTLADGGDAGLLPTSSFYFLKEWKRGFVKFFKFGAGAKAEYELEIVDEKARELAEVEVRSPNDGAALTRALENYVSGKELLEARFASMTKATNDATRLKAEEILDKWDAKIDEHRALFDDLAERHSDIPEVGEVTRKLDWATPMFKFRGNIKDVMEQTRRTQDTEEFRDAVKDIEDLKDDIKAGVEARVGFRTNCAAIIGDIDALNARLVTGKLDPQEFARQVGVLLDEKKKCEKN